MVLAHDELGPKWAKITQMLRKRRTDNAVKNRYVCAVGRNQEKLEALKARNCYLAANWSLQQLMAMESDHGNREDYSHQSRRTGQVELSASTCHIGGNRSASADENHEPAALSHGFKATNDDSSTAPAAATFTPSSSSLALVAALGKAHSPSAPIKDTILLQPNDDHLSQKRRKRTSFNPLDSTSRETTHVQAAFFPCGGGREAQKVTEIASGSSKAGALITVPTPNNNTGLFMPDHASRSSRDPATSWIVENAVVALHQSFAAGEIDDGLVSKPHYDLDMATPLDNKTEGYFHGVAMRSASGMSRDPSQQRKHRLSNNSRRHWNIEMSDPAPAVATDAGLQSAGPMETGQHPNSSHSITKNVAIPYITSMVEIPDASTASKQPHTTAPSLAAQKFQAHPDHGIGAKTPALDASARASSANSLLPSLGTSDLLDDESNTAGSPPKAFLESLDGHSDPWYM